MAKPIKTLELHYPMIQFLIISDIPQFWLGNIRSREAFRLIARKQKDLMDYKPCYSISHTSYVDLCVNNIACTD